MAKKVSPWLIGCGVGCAGLVILIIVVFGGGMLFLRDTMSGFEQAVELRAEIESRFGKPEDFVPPSDGAIAPERMEAFLRVREVTQPQRLEISRTFESFPMTEEQARELEQKSGWEIARRVLGMVGSGVGLGADIGRLMEARNRALLANDMGMGEYTYIYTLAYYSLLGHSAQDGPQSLNDQVKVDIPRLDRRVQRRMLQILQNQLQTSPEGNPVLAAEVEKLQLEPHRVPYADGLPAQLERSLDPYRERLEATYNVVTNQFELSLNRRAGRFSIKSE